ncbi:MAG: hypothetical protein V3U76_18325 [Granulosicoccus sp.]
MIRSVKALSSSVVLAIAMTGAIAHASSHIDIATSLQQVQSGTLDGRDYLTIHIAGLPTGPAACRSNILKVDSIALDKTGRQQKIEAIALSAVLNADTVMVSVHNSHCIDGNPTFTNLYLLPASP